MPKWLDLANDLSDQIDHDVIAVGDALPSWRTLKTMYSAADGTVRRALDHLESLGLVERKHGLGIYVIAKPGEGAPRIVTVQQRLDDHERRLRALEETPDD